MAVLHYSRTILRSNAHSPGRSTFEKQLTNVSAASTTTASSSPVLENTSLTLTYRRPTLAKNFYILRASASIPGPDEPVPIPANATIISSVSSSSDLHAEKDLTKQARGENRIALPGSGGSQGKEITINATLENLEGKVCVKSTSTWLLESRASISEPGDRKLERNIGGWTWGLVNHLVRGWSGSA